MPSCAAPHARSSSSRRRAARLPRPAPSELMVSPSIAVQAASASGQRVHRGGRRLRQVLVAAAALRRKGVVHKADREDVIVTAQFHMPITPTDREVAVELHGMLVDLVDLALSASMRTGTSRDRTSARCTGSSTSWWTRGAG